MRELCAEGERLRAFQRLFALSEADLPELDDTAAEVELKESLWRALGSLAEQAAGWRAERFFEVCATCVRCSLPLALRICCSVVWM